MICMRSTLVGGESLSIFRVASSTDPSVRHADGNTLLCPCSTRTICPFDVNGAIVLGYVVGCSYKYNLIAAEPLCFFHCKEIQSLWRIRPTPRRASVIAGTLCLSCSHSAVWLVASPPHDRFYTVAKFSSPSSVGRCTTFSRSERGGSS